MNTKWITMTILSMTAMAMLFIIGFNPAVAAESKAETTNAQKPIIKTLPPEEVGKHANRLLLQINAAIESGLGYEKALEKT